MVNEGMRSPRNIQIDSDMHDANAYRPLGSMMSALKVNGVTIWLAHQAPYYASKLLCNT